MKRKIFTPIIAIIAISLWAFKPAPISTSKVITCSDGTIIIPSSAPITTADKSSVLSIISSYGSHAGYLVYTNSSGATQVYNAPSGSSVLSELDADYGSDLASGSAFSGYLGFISSLGYDKVGGAKVASSTPETAAMTASLQVVLAKYE